MSLCSIQIIKFCGASVYSFVLLCVGEIKAVQVPSVG